MYKYRGHYDEVETIIIANMGKDVTLFGVTWSDDEVGGIAIESGIIQEKTPLDQEAIERFINSKDGRLLIKQRWNILSSLESLRDTDAKFLTVSEVRDMMNRKDNIEEMTKRKEARERLLKVTGRSK